MERIDERNWVERVEKVRNEEYRYVKKIIRGEELR
jgi:hypothetical protein